DPMADSARFPQGRLDVVCQSKTTQVTSVQLPSPPDYVSALLSQPSLAVALHVAAPRKEFRSKVFIQGDSAGRRFPLSLVPTWIRFEAFKLLDGGTPRMATGGEIVAPSVELLTDVENVAPATISDDVAPLPRALLLRSLAHQPSTFWSPKVGDRWGT